MFEAKNRQLLENLDRDLSTNLGKFDTDTTKGTTTDEINRVMRAHTGVFRACYLRELQRTPGLAGKVVLQSRA